MNEPLKTAYIALNGDDATAQLDDRTRPFKTHAAAEAALKPHVPRVQIFDLGFIKPQAQTP